MAMITQFMNGGLVSLKAYSLVFVLTAFPTNYVSAADGNGLSTRGLVRSAARVELRTDIAARVDEARFFEGMRFEKGDQLIAFDCRRQKAELESVEAVALGAAVELSSKTTLRRNGAAGKSEVLIAKANAQKAKADTKALRARLSSCAIVAPFQGRVVSLQVREHEMPAANEPLMVIIDDTDLELELVVPSVWLTWLEPGRNFSFTVDETGFTHTASIVRLGAEVDPVSQTIKAYGKFLGGRQKVLPGMSGVAQFLLEGS